MKYGEIEFKHTGEVRENVDGRYSDVQLTLSIVTLTKLATLLTELARLSKDYYEIKSAVEFAELFFNISHENHRLFKINIDEEPEGEIKTEKPKTFKNIEDGVQYHKENKVTGWFIVGEKVFWCYSDGIFSMTTMTPSKAKEAKNIINQE